MKSSPKIISLPQHAAIIMDGNNRWAKEKGLPGVTGHQKGVERAREAVEHAVKRKLKILTLFTFSSENWGRSEEEVNLLMNLLAEALEDEVANLVKNSVQLKFVGDLDRFDSKLNMKMKDAEENTKVSSPLKKLDLVIAASYGGRWDIVEAAKKIRDLNKDVEINEELVNSFTSLSSFSDPDLCIRTGGDFRVSNFLLWHLAYTELYFSDKFWPDFDCNQFQLALDEYSRRQRRFGNKSNFEVT